MIKIIFTCLFLVFNMATIKFRTTYMVHICGLWYVSLDYAEPKQEG